MKVRVVIGAEEPLSAGSSCLLGSINLAEFVDKNGNIDFDELGNVAYEATIALNEVLDEGMPLHPLAEQRKSVRDWRSIGLGVFGFADMLIKMGVRYGSKESIELAEHLASCILNYSALSSCNLAVTNHPFPMYDKESLLKSKFFKENITEKVQEAIRQYGLYNNQLLTIPPTGTLSTMLGVSGGLEPIFANHYQRKTESLYGQDKYFKVYTPIVKKYMQEHNLEDDSQLPNFFVTASDIKPVERVKMQAAWQKYIDASISSTVNLPEEATVEDIATIYLEAWKNGLKGITVFRNNCRRVGILTTTPSPEEKQPQTEQIVFDKIVPISRKELGTTHGNTYCRHCACGTLYITVNCDDDGDLVETFIESSKGGICKANTAAVNRLVSVALRSGVKVDEIIDQLRGIYCPACAKTNKTVDGLSCPDIMAKTLHAFYYGEEEIPQKNVVKSKRAVEMAAAKTNSEKCPECGEPIHREGGCVICSSCGWSKCG